MKKLYVSHGGSGEGITSWAAWGVDCLIAQDLQARGIHADCKPGPRLLGTMVHIYLDAWRRGEIDAGEEVLWLDDQCLDDPNEEMCAEALRLFTAYSVDHCERNPARHGSVVATELQLEGRDVEDVIGVSPFTARLDLIVGDADGMTLIDYKTASASGDGRYRFGRGRMQLHAYWLAARAKGYPVDTIQVHQITKAKTPKVNIYSIDPPTPGDVIALRRFVAYAKHRRETAVRGPHLTDCDHCQWLWAGNCLRGVVSY